jgi:hypothetical protein
MMRGGAMTKSCKCIVCGTDCEKEEVKRIEIKGKTKDICKECVVAIKGLA